MIIDAVSDLHGHYPELEGGDLLIVAGDLTARDTVDEVDDFSLWLHRQDYKKIIYISGNHDNYLQRKPDFTWIHQKTEYLCDSGTEFEGLKIWGSPWNLWFKNMNPHCMAFTLHTEEELAEKWALIPDDIDILITHSPPYGILDRVKGYDGNFLKSVGSRSLALKVGKMLSPPKLWVWGHIHESYGIDMPIRSKPCKMVNASHVNRQYEPVNKPIRVVL